MSTKEAFEAEYAECIAAWSNMDIDGVLAKGFSGFPYGVGFGFRTQAARNMDELPMGSALEILRTFFSSMEYYRIDLEELNVSIDGDVAIAWGVHVEDFQEKGKSPERVRVRFTDVARRHGDAWRTLIFHRDIQPFGSDGRYLR